MITAPWKISAWNRRAPPSGDPWGPDGGARSLLLDAGVVSRVGPIDGVDWRRGDVIEVAAVLFEVRVLRTREAVGRLVFLVPIDVRIVQSDDGVRNLNAVAASFVIGGGILVAVVPVGVAGALLAKPELSCWVSAN